MILDRQDALTKLLAAARGASELVMRVYGRADVGEELKGPNDPVTRADKEANAFLLARLGAEFPGLPIVAEESDPATFRGFEAAHVALFVDPVDGTRDFIAKNGEFCVMIGLAEEGRATVGVVLCPAFRGRSHAYGAAEGLGAFLFGDDGARTPIRVSAEKDLHRARAAVSRFHRDEGVDARLEALGVRELVPTGSSGIKGALVANGELDLYVHPSGSAVKLWDACAPDAIVHAAGGLLTDAEGVPFDYRGAVAQGEGTLAGNHRLHAEAVQKLVAHGAGRGTSS